MVVTSIFINKERDEIRKMKGLGAIGCAAL